MKTDKGFSLLELLIVVAIILIIATIAIPSLLRSRQAANESSAVANIRTFNTAQVSYASAGGASSYGTIGELTAAGLIDSRFSGMFSGFTFGLDLSADRLQYTVYATAAAVNTGRYDYYSTPDLVIRYSTDSSRAPSGLNGEPVR